MAPRGKGGARITEEFLEQRPGSGNIRRYCWLRKAWHLKLRNWVLFCVLCCLVSKLCLTFLWPCRPWTMAHQVPLSIGFFRQEYWSALPFPSLFQCKRRWKVKADGSLSCLMHFSFWGQYPMLFLSHLRVQPGRAAAVSDRLMVWILFPSCIPSGLTLGELWWLKVQTACVYWHGRWLS